MGLVVAVSFHSCNDEYYKWIGKKEELLKIIENVDLIKIIDIQNKSGYIYFEKEKDFNEFFFEFEKLSKKLDLCFLWGEIVKVTFYFYDLSIYPTCTVGGDESWE